MTQVSDENPYSAWETTLAAIAETRGVTLVLGGTDVGKTTFTRLLLHRLVERHGRAAVIDADLGQSDVGPPACIGLAFAETPVLALSDLTPHALAFVGSTSPPGYLLEYVAGVKRLAELAGSCPLVVDTSGYLQGGAAARLNHAAFDLLSPAHVVALQRRGELESILAPMRRRDGCTVHTPPVPDVIGRKPTAFRTQRRAMRFAAYFAGSTRHTFAFSEVALTGTWLGSAPPLAPHLLKFLNQTLGPPTKVYHAEMCDRQLGLMVSRPLPPDLPALGIAQQQLKAQSVAITVAPRLKHLLLGLEGGNGRLLGLGLLEALDFRAGTLGVLTPVRAPAAARILRFGSLRLLPDGTEVGSLRPREL